MAHGQNTVVFLRHLSHFNDFFLVGRHGLFTKYMISLFQSHDRRLIMHPVHGADHGTICQLFFSKKLFIAFEAKLIRNIMSFCKTLSALFIRLCNCYYLKFIRMVQCILGINMAASKTCSNHNTRYLFHTLLLLSQTYF